MGTESIALRLGESLAPKLLPVAEKAATALLEDALPSALNTGARLSQLMGFSRIGNVVTRTGETIAATSLRLEGLGSTAGLKGLIGRASPEELRSVTELGLHGSATNDTIPLLAKFPNLDSLSICSDRITNAGLDSIGQLPGLRKLRLVCSGIGDGVLKHISGLTELESLKLMQAPIEGSGLQHISGLKNLTNIHLFATRINDGGITVLCESISSGQLSQLESLGLRATKITDAALKTLGELGETSNLKTLDISANQVTDRGLGYLDSLKNLRSLSVGETPITRDAVTRLERAIGSKLKVINPPREAQVMTLHTNNTVSHSTRYWYPGE